MNVHGQYNYMLTCDCVPLLFMEGVFSVSPIITSISILPDMVSLVKTTANYQFNKDAPIIFLSHRHKM